MSSRPTVASPPADTGASSHRAYARAAFDGCANALSALLNRAVTAELVDPLRDPHEPLSAVMAPPWLVAEARASRGLAGVHALCVTRADALALAQLALGEDGGEIDPASPDVDDTLREIVAHMVSSAAASLTSVLGRPVALGTPDVTALADGEWTPDAAAVAVGTLMVDGHPVGRLAVAIPAPGVAESAADTGGRRDSAPAESSIPASLDMILDISMPVTVELGRTRMLIRDILALGPGSVIELEKLAGEPVDLLVNERPIARGEVVVIDENFGVRLTEISHPSERLRSLA
jgi:flagellar motor switch protein FliN